MFGGIKNKVNFLISVELVDSLNISKEEEIIIYRYPLLYFKELTAAYIYSENENDCEFYKSISKFRMKSEFGAFFDINLENSYGNGRQTGEIFKRKIQEGKFIFAIIDGDICNGNKTSFGGTAKALLDVLPEIENVLYDVYLLPVHEKENLLPLEYYRYHCKKDRLQTINQLIKIREFNSEFLIYFDFKNGLDNKNYHEYYAPIFDIEGVIPENEIANQDSEVFFGNFVFFEELLSKPERFYLIRGLGKSVLSDFKSIENYIYKLEQKEQLNSFSEEREFINEIITKLKDFDSVLFKEQLEAWEKISELVFSYGIAVNRTATNTFTETKSEVAVAG